MRRSSFIALTAFWCTAVSLDAANIAYWNFNGYDGDAKSISADSGAGVLDVAPMWPEGDLNNFAGSTVNALFNDPAGESLSLLQPPTDDSSFLTIRASTVGFRDVSLSFATRRTSTGFSSNQFSYSTNGGSTFTNFGSAYNPTTSTTFELISFDFSTIPDLSNNPDAQFRITFDGATSASGNNRIDNIQINGVPEPSRTLLLLFGALGIMQNRRR